MKHDNEKPAEVSQIKAVKGMLAASVCLCLVGLGAGIFALRTNAKANQQAVSAAETVTAPETSAVTQTTPETTTAPRETTAITTTTAPSTTTTTLAVTTAATEIAAEKNIPKYTIPEDLDKSKPLVPDDKYIESQGTYYVYPQGNYVIRLYQNPSEESSFAILPLGTKVELLTDTGESMWYYVKSENYSGWCESWNVIQSKPYIYRYDEVEKPSEIVYSQNLFNDTKNIFSDTLDLRVSPNYECDVIQVLSFGDPVVIFGFNDAYDDWSFVMAKHEEKEYFGWIDTGYSREPRNIYPRDVMEQKCQEYNKTFERSHETELTGYGGKPVIYLYPEKETDINVQVEPDGVFWTTYPKYGKNGWDVTAYPDGRIVNKADGHTYDYLFWDSVECKTRYDMSRGFCIKGEDTEAFLREKLAEIGLNEREMNEFIVYWLPLMEHNEYNIIAFQSDVYAANNKLTVTPAPDSVLRVFMTYRATDHEVNIEPQTFGRFERKGFTVVEWGGSDLERHGIVS